MFRFARGVIVLAAAFLTTPAAAQGAKSEKPAKPPLIRSIVVRGPLGLSADVVSSMSMLSPGLRATPGALETGRLLVVESIAGVPEQDQWLRKNLAVRSEPAPDDPGKVDVVFEVPYNGPTRRFGGRGGFRGGRVALPVITGVNVTGSGPIPPKEVMARLRAKPGQPADFEILRGDGERVSAYFDSKGFIATVTGPGPQIANGVVDIQIVVSKILRMRFEGLKSVPEEAVRRHLTVKPGDYYNALTFKKDYAALLKTGLFEDIQPVVLTAGPGNLELVLRFVEKK